MLKLSISLRRSLAKLFMRLIRALRQRSFFEQQTFLGVRDQRLGCTAGAARMGLATREVEWAFTAALTQLDLITGRS